MVKEREWDKKGAQIRSWVSKASNHRTWEGHNRQKRSEDIRHKDKKDRAEEQTNCQSSKEKDKIAEKIVEVKKGGRSGY